MGNTFAHPHSVPGEELAVDEHAPSLPIGAAQPSRELLPMRLAKGEGLGAEEEHLGAKLPHLGWRDLGVAAPARRNDVTSTRFRE